VSRPAYTAGPALRQAIPHPGGSGRREGPRRGRVSPNGSLPVWGRVRAHAPEKLLSTSAGRLPPESESKGVRAASPFPLSLLPPSWRAAFRWASLVLCPARFDAATASRTLAPAERHAIAAGWGSTLLPCFRRSLALVSALRTFPAGLEVVGEKTPHPTLVAVPLSERPPGAALSLRPPLLPRGRPREAHLTLRAVTSSARGRTPIPLLPT